MQGAHKRAEVLGLGAGKFNGRLAGRPSFKVVLEIIPPHFTYAHQH